MSTYIAIGAVCLLVGAVVGGIYAADYFLGYLQGMKRK